MATAPCWGFDVREFQKEFKQFLWSNSSSVRTLTNTIHRCRKPAPATLALSLFREHTRHGPTSGHPSQCPLHARPFSDAWASHFLPAPTLCQACAQMPLYLGLPTTNILLKIGTCTPPHTWPETSYSALLFYPQHWSSNPPLLLYN